MQKLTSYLRTCASELPLVGEILIRKRIAREFNKSIPTGILPRQLAIETVNHCNARCIMCPHTKMRRRKGVMSPETHRLAISKVKAWAAPIKHISHAGLGEPLLDRDIANKIFHEKRIFPEAQVTMYTNGFALTEDRAIELLASGLDVLSVSINAFTPELYRKITNLSYDQTHTNVIRFLEMNRRNRKVTVNVSLIPTPDHSPNEIRQFRNYWLPRVDNVFIPPLITWGGFIGLRTKKKQYPCRYLFEVFQMDWDGTVIMCCEDYDARYPLGNILNAEPQNIWNSPFVQGVRRRMVEGDFSLPDMCENCIESQRVARDFWKITAGIRF